MAILRGTRRLRISWLSLLLFYATLLLLTWVLAWGRFTTNVDQLLHDSWVRLLQRPAPEDVVIIGIDANSLDQLGRWPWPRNLQAALFSRLARSDIRGAALDLLYVEPDNFTDNDEIIASAIGQLPLVVLPVLTEARSGYTDYVEKLPIPEITRHVSKLGHIFTPIDSDGIVRRVFLKTGFNTAHWPALGLALAQALGEVGDDNLPGRRADADQRGGWIEDHEALVPFYGTSGTFTHISVFDVINNRMPEGFLTDKVVFIGMTATGTGDMLPTAVSATDRPMPGVEIHANIYASVRAGTLVTEMDARWNYVVAAAVLLVILLLYSQLPPLWGMISTTLLACLPIVLSFILYRYFNLWYAPLGATVPVLISYFLWSWHRLEFVADFLRRETGSLVRDLDPFDYTDNQLLARFFDNAARHLPVDGWRFSAAGQVFSGGNRPEEVRADNRDSRWSEQGNTHVKRYPTRGKLEIAFTASDREFSSEFKYYIDSLSLVTERQNLSKLSGAFERLQSHTLQLHYQLDRLRNMKHLSDSIFSGSPAGLLVWSASGEIVQVNELAQHMLPSNQVWQQSLNDFLTSVGRDPEAGDREQVSALIQNRVPWQINWNERESEFVINLSAVGHTLADRLISASITDVTEIRKSERSRAEMVEYMSHDLRSPLISSLYLLKSDEGDDVILDAEHSARIETNINHSLAMMDDLLNIARADNLTPDVFNLVLFDSIIDNAYDQISPQARGKHIDLDLDMQAEDLWIKGDASLLERALVNVIGNAIKYSPEDTVVKLITRRNGDNLVFQVVDQGIGIAPDMMEGLFQRFKRDSKVARQYKGIGLGLALVARVVSQHGGSVRAESPGQGTMIELTLPLVDDDDLE